MPKMILKNYDGIAIIFRQMDTMTQPSSIQNAAYRIKQSIVRIAIISTIRENNRRWGNHQHIYL